MGVPSFYRWLVGKYPKAVVKAVDPGDSENYQPNPNGEFHNFYLDMNGIIHPCFHPEDELFPPTTFDEVFKAIFDYIDLLFRIVRPTKLLFIAIDGVAPRAKMNQQRARRYKTAKDAEIAEVEEERLRKEFEREGKKLLPVHRNSEVADSNIITPGTVFMQNLSKALEGYITERMKSDPGWRNLEVILSDANVPGEGEHKIMSFIRQSRSYADPNTRHCLYGLDADLIMLALTTHEIHFSILREDVNTQQQQESLSSTFLVNSSEKEKAIFSSRQWFKNTESSNKKKPYQFLNIWTLREYLEIDMMPQCDSYIDIERIVDDFIFICFFTGNDFLPHLPSIEIHEGAIDLLIAVYKKLFKSMGGHLVDMNKIKDKNHGYINTKRVEMFILQIGTYEEKIFEKRHSLLQKKLRRLLQEMSVEEGNKESNDLCHSFNEHCVIPRSCASNAAQASSFIQSDASENTKEFKQKMKQFLRDKGDVYKNGMPSNDKVMLGQFGWKGRYYKAKFCANNSKEMEDTRRRVVEKYAEGLCWVLQYYFSGVPSWSWFYPFHYGPFASDLKGLASAKVSFLHGSPFKPFDQLMAVLPPRSSHALPEAYRRLMEKEDSPIIHFYPWDFEVDCDGKRYEWQGICKLPFIEERLLQNETKKLCKELKEEETERNSIKPNRNFGMNSADKTVECWEFHTPEHQNHIPRLREGTMVPEKTITESDIVDRSLWHESKASSHQPAMMRQPNERMGQLPPIGNETWEGGLGGWSGRGRQLVVDSSALRHGSRDFVARNVRAQYVPGPSSSSNWSMGDALGNWRQGLAPMPPAYGVYSRGRGRGRGPFGDLMPRWSSNGWNGGTYENWQQGSAPIPFQGVYGSGGGAVGDLMPRWSSNGWNGGTNENWRQTSAPMAAHGVYGRGNGPVGAVMPCWQVRGATATATATATGTGRGRGRGRGSGRGRGDDR